ncbi:MAG: hypothetical protein ACP5G1_04845 [Nanopusillaceae archaeon]
MEKEKEQGRYLTMKDVQNIYLYMLEIRNLCLENKEEIVIDIIKELKGVYGVKIEIDKENCNAFLFYKI